MRPSAKCRGTRAGWTPWRTETRVPDAGRHGYVADCIEKRGKRRLQTSRPAGPGRSLPSPWGKGPRILFERYDGGQPNQRVHFDVNVIQEPVDQAERVERLHRERIRLEGLGASFKREATGMAGEYWIEMFDPEGNWFCVQ